MENIRISAIAAVGNNNELGKNNDLIWRLKADFTHMKDTIRGHTLVMGRSTYESIGRELPYPSVLITGNADYKSPYQDTKHTHIATSLDEAIKKATELEIATDNENKEVFIFGGARVYTDALPQTERLYLTHIDASDDEADTFFPDYSEFTKVLSEETQTEDGINFRFLTLERQ